MLLVRVSKLQQSFPTHGHSLHLIAFRGFRLGVVRDVEDMSTSDAAEVLESIEDNVKVRLHRARALLRKSLYARAGMERKEAFNFHAARCDRVVKNVFEQIKKQVRKTGTSTAKTQ